MSDFMHRISHCNYASYPLLFEKEILSIGWSDLAISQNFLNEYRSDFHRAYIENWGEANRARNSLSRFLLDMHPNDRVIVPSWGVFHAYKIISDVMLVQDIDIKGLKSWRDKEIIPKDGFLYEKGTKEEKIDLGFFRKVEKIELDVSRNSYCSPPLISMLKFRGTNNQIDHLTGDIDKAIQAKRSNKPINVIETIQEDKDIVKSVYQKILDSINPQSLEQLIKKYFEKSGATSVEVCPHGDRKGGDIDVNATFEAIKTLVRVQAKKHDGKTDEWAVNQIIEYRDTHENYDDSYAIVEMVISTSEGFSEQCVKLSREKGVVLVNGMEFAKMLLGVGLYGIN